MTEVTGGGGIKRPRPKLDCSLTEEEEDDDNGVFVCPEFCNGAEVTVKAVHHKSSCVP